MSSKDEIKGSGPEFQRRITMLGPREAIQIKHVEEILGSLDKILTPEQLARLKKKQKTSEILPETYLNSTSHEKLAKYLDKHFSMLDDFKFTNVNQNLTYKPAVIVHPTKVEEIQQIVLESIKKKRRVRVVGFGHSWTPIFPEDESVLIQLDNMKGISANLDGPDEEWTCTVHPGDEIGDIDDYLSGRYAAIPTNVVMDHVGMIALIVMGCHGTGLSQKCISDLCVGFKVVDGKGVLRNFTKKELGDEKWAALAVSLGLFGIVYEVTFRFNVRVRDFKENMDKVFKANGGEQFKKLVKESWGAQFFWMPFNAECWVKVFDKSDQVPEENKVQVVRETFSNWVAMNFGVQTGDFLTAVGPLVPLFLKAGLKSIPEGDRVLPIDRAIHWEKYLDKIVIWTTEFVFPLRLDNEQDWDNIINAWYTVVKLVDVYEKKGKYPLNLTAEMRFTTGSDALLSPGGGNQYTCYMEIVSSINAPGWEEFSKDVSLEWMKIPGARPHWAKYCQHVPGIQKFINKAYGPKIKEFLKIRKELDVDPTDMFYTDWLATILEPEKYPVGFRHIAADPGYCANCKCSMM